jgi:hypothetical protein
MSSGSGSEGDDGSGDIVGGKLGCPAAINNHDTPKAIFWVAPPLQEDGFTVEGEFATCFVKENLAAHVAQDGNGEGIVNKASELMS